MIDPVRELSVRCIAHNLEQRFGPVPRFGTEQEQADYAEAIARAIDNREAHALALAGLSLWRSAREDGGPVYDEADTLVMEALSDV